MSETKTVPPQKHTCDCGEPVAVLRAKVQKISSGKIYVGPFSQFASVNKSGAMTLRPDYRFIVWIGECASCFYKVPQEELFA